MARNDRGEVVAGIDNPAKSAEASRKFYERFQRPKGGQVAPPEEPAPGPSQEPETVAEDGGE